MKKLYKRIKQEQYYCPWRKAMVDRWHPSYINAYTFTFYSYYRYVRTFNEIRQNEGALADGYEVRGKRKHLPTVWDDVRIDRKYKKSWKDFTKHRKQYMVNL